jgi:hypothetical protein
VKENALNLGRDYEDSVISVVMHVTTIPNARSRKSAAIMDAREIAFIQVCFWDYFIVHLDFVMKL